MHWQNAYHMNTVAQTQNASTAGNGDADSQGKEYFIEQIAQVLEISKRDIEAELSNASAATLKQLAVEVGGEVQSNAAEYPGGELGVDGSDDPTLATNDGGESNPAAYPDGEL